MHAGVAIVVVGLLAASIGTSQAWYVKKNKSSSSWSRQHSTKTNSSTVSSTAAAAPTVPPQPAPTSSTSTTTTTQQPQPSQPAPPPSSSTGAAPAIHVDGNHIVTDTGAVVQLRGVNRSGAEYAAPEGWGIFDGPTDDDASVLAIKAWGVNAVRVPMSETAWLGINGVAAQYSGANYRNAIVDYVNRLNRLGIIAILNLHYAAPGTSKGSDQYPMADADHAGAFWQSVATTFKDNHSVVFDLFNEPFPDNNRDTTAAWTCVRDGGTCPGVSYQAEGMQDLVNIVRFVGATQPLAIGGPEYAGDLDRWLEFEPSDPLHQLIASVHIYGLPLDSPLRVSSDWDSVIAPVAAQVPVYIGEFGDTDCTSKFSPPLMSWADAHGVSYTAWSWVVSSCADEPSLITDYNGTPTAYGIGVRNHLQALPPSW